MRMNAGLHRLRQAQVRTAPITFAASRLLLLQFLSEKTEAVTARRSDGRSNCSNNADLRGVLSLRLA